MTTAMLDALLDIALDLTASLPSSARYERLLAALRRVVPCDAAAILRHDAGALVPVATAGLLPQAMAQRFRPSEHPRLAAILSSRRPVRFDAANPRPDPYDGFVTGSPDHQPHVHSCMGASLYLGDELVGALTADALAPDAFDDLDDEAFATFAALAAAAMHTAGLIDALEATADHREQVARHLTRAALVRHGGDLIGQSPEMAALRRELAVLASSDLTVLITGETGVGKELVARMVHDTSPRAAMPLVYVNCAALPESIAESELFGHVRGAFTGAVDARAGRFELAHRGTLFLDEIGELPLSIQPKLLRTLQEGEIQRVGADRELRVDVRIIAATNHHLPTEVAEGRFRPDLYHRLSVYPVRVPALRERQGDVPLLAAALLDRACRQLGLGSARLTPAAIRTLEAYHWPGNVRELEHVVLRAALRASGGRPRAHAVIDTDHLELTPSPAAAPPPPQEIPPLAEATRDFQRRMVERAVEAAGGNWGPKPPAPWRSTEATSTASPAASA